MGYRVTRDYYIRLKQIERELGTRAALEVLKDGFKYGNAEVIRPVGKENFEIVQMHWEFIPPFVKSMEELKEMRKKGIPWLNATGENLFINKQGKKAMWADAALRRRCLVPATHFFEWRHYKPEGEKKDIAFPYCVHLKDWKNIFMAAIWQPWTDKTTGETIDTFAIVTTSANRLMKKVHNKKERMPVMLPEDLAAEWIWGDIDEKRISEIATYQYDENEMEAFTIRKDFKLISDPLEAFEYQELPPL